MRKMFCPLCSVQAGQGASCGLRLKIDLVGCTDRGLTREGLSTRLPLTEQEVELPLREPSLEEEPVARPHPVRT